jgi:polyisoprenoid-binding protein YceI
MEISIFDKQDRIQQVSMEKSSFSTANFDVRHAQTSSLRGSAKASEGSIAFDPEVARTSASLHHRMTAVGRHGW